MNIGKQRKGPKFRRVIKEMVMYEIYAYHDFKLGKRDISPNA
jgi:hypothetical protein